MAKVTMVLALQVTFDTKGANESELEGNLLRLGDFAAGAGMMTQMSNAEVEEWSSEVKTICQED